MPRRIPADPALVLAVYERTGSGLKTAVELGLHQNTVYGIIRRARGDCLRCRNKAVVGRKYCATCLRHIADRKSNWRKERRRLGLCVECDERVDFPVSRTLCSKHRVKALDASRAKRPAKNRFRGDREKQRTANLKRLYGQPGVDAWHRDSGACVICGDPWPDVRIEMHHIDLDETNDTITNLACLCVTCHKAIHGIIKAVAHPHAVAVAAWVRQTYPEMSEFWQVTPTPTGRSA